MLGHRARALSPSSQARLLSRFSIYDVAWAAVSPVLAFIVRNGGIDRVDAMLIYCSAAFICSVVTFQLLKISQPMSRFFSAPDAVAVIKACLISVSVAGALLFTFTRMGETPRAVPVIHFFALATGLLVGRSISRIRYRRREARKRESLSESVENIIIVGVSRLAWFYSKLVEEFAEGESRIIALLDEQSRLQHRSLNGYLIAGSPSHASNIFDEYAAHGVEVHRIVVAILPDKLSDAAWSEIKGISKQRGIAFEILPERLLLSPSKNKLARIHSSDFGRVRWTTSDRWDWNLKRIVDILFAAAVLFAVSPLAIIVALLVLVDVGYPVVFWQERVGRFGKPLHVYKFRTMRAPFNRKGHHVLDSERLSPVGQFLRAIRLDEIPQLWNILTGEMSVVGPRPLLPVDQPKMYSTRLEVRPGLTGLAQVSGGKLLSIEEKNAFDEHYVRCGSIFRDFSILARTVWVMLRGDRRNEAIIAAVLAEEREHGKAKNTTLRTLEISSEALSASREGALLMAGGGS
jgi:lipopolysaccharide/colanic/teichoic acid biosynthesis glycosyltransferase